ncbi:hypothetical protein ACIRRH_15810 [Kitasatospora sp. NPDC101235]
MVLPARLAARVRGAEGRVALHRFQRAEDQPPGSAEVLPKVI